LCEIEFGKIFVSPLRRTRQTLEHARLDSVQCTLDSRIVEYRAPGMYTEYVLPYAPIDGYGDSDIHEAWETPFAERIRAFMKELRQSKYEKILAVTHGGASIGMANDILRGGRLESTGVENKLQGMENCAIAVFHLHPDPEECRMVRWNDIGHLHA
ncbi:MAG: histidine phosphatase family protein, partial [Candidatus Sumerlaeota bacterium]